MILTLDAIKEKCFDILDKTEYVQQAYLFGSYARNEATDDSDIDVMISLNRFVGWVYFELYDKLQEAFGKNVDVITEKEMLNDEEMTKRIKKDRVIIYERENN